jgi:endonuclease YncB( thermonuclease family)
MLVRARVWTLLVIGILLGAGAVFGVGPARAQQRFAATVASVVDGDTLNAQVAGGPALDVQLIGIDAPEPGDCGGAEAAGQLKQLALGRTSPSYATRTSKSSNPQERVCSTSTEMTAEI